jgi:hypothetical protein
MVRRLLAGRGSYPPDAPVIRASLPLISLSTTMIAQFERLFRTVSP